MGRDDRHNNAREPALGDLPRTGSLVPFPQALRVAHIIEQPIGMPFIIIMQQQPGMLMQAIIQSQQA